MVKEKIVISEASEQANDTFGPISVVGFPKRGTRGRTLIHIRDGDVKRFGLALTPSGVKEMVKFLIDEL